MRLLPLALLSLVLGVAAAQTVHSQNQPAPLQVGFVDIQKVLTDYRKRPTIDRDVKAHAEQLRQEFKQRRADIEAKRDKLATLNDESEESLALQRETEIALLTLKRDQEYADQDLNREQNRKIGLLYREICAEVRVQAEKRGLAAVYGWDPLPGGFESRMNSLALIDRRDVLWADPRLDITDAVVESLNAQLPAELPPPQPSNGK